MCSKDAGRMSNGADYKTVMFAQACLSLRLLWCIMFVNCCIDWSIQLVNFTAGQTLLKNNGKDVLYNGTGLMLVWMRFIDQCDLLISNF